MSGPSGRGQGDEPPSVSIGANLFHQWAASRLPPNVYEAHGHRFAYGSNQQLFPLYPFVTEIDEMLVKAGVVEWGPRLDETQREMARELGLPAPPNLPPGLACPICPCGTKSEWADCLIHRFHDAFESITDERIARWYSRLPERKARHVLAFIQAETPPDPLFRRAHELIRTWSTGDSVPLKGARGRHSEKLRDAFALTAMVAVNKWLKLPLVNAIAEHDECAALVAGVFGMNASTLRRRWNTVASKVRETGRMQDAADLRRAYFLRTR